MISIPLYFNLNSVSLNIIGSDWDHELLVYGISMSPALKDGEFVCVDEVDPSAIQAAPVQGDIIVFNRPHRQIPLASPVVVHRAINRTVRNDLGILYFETKGDHNLSPDFWSDVRGEEYVWNGMISQRLLIGKVVAVRKPYALERPALIMVAFTVCIVVADFCGYVGILRRRKTSSFPNERGRN